LLIDLIVCLFVCFLFAKFVIVEAKMGKWPCLNSYLGGQQHNQRIMQKGKKPGVSATHSEVINASDFNSDKHKQRMPYVITDETRTEFSAKFHTHPHRIPKGKVCGSGRQAVEAPLRSLNSFGKVTQR
jgi:hypothetical protein